MLLQLVCLLGGGTAYTERHVNSDTGVDNSTCWEGSTPCATLAYALEDLHSDTTVLLDNEVVSHPNITTVQGGPISNITISGYHGNTVIDCSEKGGFAFINVSELTITSVEFHGCGVQRNSTCYDPLGRSIPYMMALYLYNCTNVFLVSTTISYSPGAGVVMLAVTGRVNIIDSTFLHNGFRISRNGSHINETTLTGKLSGGGLKIELPSCPPGVNSTDCKGSNDMCPPAGSPLPKYTDVAYNIENCSFINNTAETPKFTIFGYDNFFGSEYFTTIGRGGGVSVFIKGVSQRIQITVTSCHFEDNWSLYGAGMFMELWHMPDNVSLSITGSTFSHNHLPYNSTQNIGTGGGGVRYAQLYCPQHQHEGNILLISGCNFNDNKAYWGGGVSVVLLPQQNSLPGDAVLFQSCLFVGNVARIGAAIDFQPNYNSDASVLPQAMLQDVQFANNSVKYGDDLSYINGEGIVYIASTTVYVKSSLNISHNHGNGLSSLYSTVHFLNGSTSHFYDNQAYRGAALALYGNAAIVLHNGSQLNFTENKADTVGGAIYHTALGNRALLNNGACPIRMAAGLNWSNTDLWFINNTAAQGRRGMSIYIYSFYPCVEIGLKNLFETLKWSAFHYQCNTVKFPNCSDLQVSGDGRLVKHNGTATLSLTAFPGEKAPLPFTVEDELHNKVKINFEGVVHGNNLTYAVDVLNGSKVDITGKPTKNAKVELHSTESQTLTVLVSLDITECPPGFLLEKNSEGIWVCECASDLSLYIGVRCNGHTMASHLRHDNWVGYLMSDNNSNASIGFQSGYCPPGFCRDRPLILNGSDHYDIISLDEVVCGPQHRTGVLCGKCGDEYGVSVLLNERFRCISCNNSSPANSFKVVIIWFFTEFVPLNIVIILFIVFNVNILSGWGGVLYSIVFYFQIVSSTPAFQYQALSADEVAAADWYGMSLFINKILSNFWNLQFFSAFVLNYSCITTTATVQDAILATYLQILVWPLIVYTSLTVVHRCYHYGHCCTPIHRCLFKMGRMLAKCRHLKGEGGVSSLAGLCSFFVLAYTRLILLTWQICMRGTIQLSNGRYRHVFLYNGTVPWFDPTHHLPYALPILLCSFVTVFIPTLLLVSFPLVPKLLVKLNLHERRPFRWIISLLSTSYLLFLYDIFQGCFKPNARYFAALYLIYRHLFVLVWSFVGWSIMRYSIYQTVLGVIFIVIHLLAQPFSSHAVNRVTGLVMTNLTLVIVLSQGMIMLDQEFERSSANDHLGAKIITIVLLCLPHFAVVILFTWGVARRIYQQITQRCASNGPTSQESANGPELEESGRHGNITDWDAYVCDRTSSGWEAGQGNRVGTGYVPLEEEDEEEEEEGREGEGKNADGQAEQLQIQRRRHATSVGMKMFSGYGSLADYRKTQ